MERKKTSFRIDPKFHAKLQVYCKAKSLLEEETNQGKLIETVVGKHIEEDLLNNPRLAEIVKAKLEKTNDSTAKLTN